MGNPPIPTALDQLLVKQLAVDGVPLPTESWVNLVSANGVTFTGTDDPTFSVNNQVVGATQISITPPSGAIDVEQSGTPLSNNPHTTLNFTGAGVTASDAGGGVATISIPGSSGITLKENGTNIPNNPHATLNVTGIGATMSDVSGVGTLTVPGMPSADSGYGGTFVNVSAVTPVGLNSSINLPTSGSYFLVVGEMEANAASGTTGISLYLQTSNNNSTWTTIKGFTVGGIPVSGPGLTVQTSVQCSIAFLVPTATGHATTYVRLAALSFGVSNTLNAQIQIAGGLT